MEEKLTTNEKLMSIINGKADDDDEAYFAQRKVKAKDSLRRCVLYGCGARANIPKVRSSHSKHRMSPFQLPTATPLHLEEPSLSSAVPPGAHNDMGKMVQLRTAKSRNDPYRMFMASSSMDPSILAINQPPWYYGDNNKTKPPDVSLLSAAARYGYRGSRGIQQYHTNPCSPPSHTRTQHTPHFLSNKMEDSIINEWVPPILAATHQTINNYETPKLWPKNAEYVTGFPVKEKRLLKSSSGSRFDLKNNIPVAYRRETTVVEPLVVTPRDRDRPQSPLLATTITMGSHLTQALSQSQNERNTIVDYARLETSGLMESLPITEQMKFQAKWSDRVKTAASSTLRHSLSKEIIPYEPHTLVDDTDVLKYSGSTAIVVRSQSNDECKFRLRLEANYSTLPYPVRWRQLRFQFRGITSRLKKEQTMQAAIEEIAASLRVDAIVLGAPTTMRRSEFVQSMTKLPMCNAFTPKQLALLYNAFDPKGKNCFRFIEFILGLTLLDQPDLSATEKLKVLWSCYVCYGSDIPPLRMALEVLSCAAASDKDRQRIEKAFKEEFRGCCYRMAVLGTNGDYSTAVAPTKNNQGGENSLQSSTSYKTDLAVPSQYNISDHFLDADNFIAVANQCPALMRAFEAQLQDRFRYLYGSDSRDGEEANTTKH